MHILIAEDDRAIAILMAEAVRATSGRNTITIVDDGQEAIDYLYGRGRRPEVAAAAPDLILLDLYMPRVNGIAVLEALRAHPHLGATPAVVVTSSRDPRDRDACFAAGATDFRIKPATFNGYVDLLREMETTWATGADLSESNTPRQPVPSHPDVAASGVATSPWTPPEPARQPETAGPVRLLAIDDDPASILLIERLLEQAPDEFEVTSATNADEAVEALARSRPDCILVDHYLPGTNSLQMLKTFADRVPGVPAILLTGSTDPRLAASALESGAANVLHKGSLLDIDLAEVVDEAIALKRGHAAPDSAHYAPGADRLGNLHAGDSDAVVTTDARGTIVYANEKASAVLGIDHAWMLGLDAFAQDGPFGGQIAQPATGSPASRILITMSDPSGRSWQIPTRLVPLRAHEPGYERSVALVFAGSLGPAPR